MRGAGCPRVTQPFATLCTPEGALTVRLACVRRAASVHPEPGSNSPFERAPGSPACVSSLGARRSVQDPADLDSLGFELTLSNNSNFALLSLVDLSIAVSGSQGSRRPGGRLSPRAAREITILDSGFCSSTIKHFHVSITKSAGAPGQCPAAPANVPRWSAATCSPTDSLRSTIGARGLNFRVRHGTGCASPAMAADQRGTFSARGAGRAPCPQGRTAGLKTTLPRRSQGPGSGKRRARPISAARLSASRRLHLRPITSWSTRGLTEGRTHLGTGFPLRCFQRLSQPDSATGRCRWSTTRAPEVRPPRSSRTRGSLPQFSYARGG